MTNIFAFLRDSVSSLNYSKSFKKLWACGGVWVWTCSIHDSSNRVCGPIPRSNSIFFFHQVWICYPKKKEHFSCILAVLTVVLVSETWEQTTSLLRGVKRQMLRFSLHIKLQQMNLFVCSIEKWKFSIRVPVMDLDTMTLSKASSNTCQNETDIEFQ